MAWDWDKLQGNRGGPTGGAGAPPGLDEVLEKIKGVREKLPGGIWLIIAAVIILFILSSCLYTVAVDEVGVVQRFGKYLEHRTTQPGLHFKLPRGIEKVTKVKVRYVFKEEFGFRTLRAGVRTRYASSSTYENESLMLTGDLNVVVVPWIVQYRIDEPDKWLFKVRDPRNTLRDLTESTMRLVVGDHSINEVINKREQIADATKVLLQKELDEAETGIKVTTIEMKRTTVPEPVEPSWNEVNQAIQEKEKMIYQAKEAYNKVIPAAKGNAEKTIKAGEGYALDRVNRAKGDAARFLSRHEEYVKAKDVTRRRLYLETILEIFPKMGDKYIVDADQKNVLPLLNIGKMKGGE
jgi:membrane protease subunit HflK